MSAAADIAHALAERIDQVAVDLIGEDPSHRGRTQWRFYPKGGLVIDVAGLSKGLWCSHGEGAVGGDALDLVRHLRGCDVAEAMRWAREWLGEASREGPPRAQASRPMASQQDTTELARRIWAEGADPKGSPVESYLRSRGLGFPERAPFRFHPECPRRDERLPAMLALMTDPVAAQPCGVHRTFLRADGRGKLEHGTAKMMAGRAGMVRLVPDEDVTLGLGLAEGIETGLALAQLADWSPVWACTSAGAIGKFPVLDGIEAVTIFADADDAGAGIRAAEACADRWVAAGREATIEKPPGAHDWLDVLAPARGTT